MSGHHALTSYTGITGTPVKIYGFIDLDIQIGDLRMSVTFAIVDDPSVPLIIGTTYQDKLIYFIQFKACTLKPIASRR